MNATQHDLIKGLTIEDLKKFEALALVFVPHYHKSWLIREIMEREGIDGYEKRLDLATKLRVFVAFWEEFVPKKTEHELMAIELLTMKHNIESLMEDMEAKLKTLEYLNKQGV